MSGEGHTRHVAHVEVLRGDDGYRVRWRRGAHLSAQHELPETYASLTCALGVLAQVLAACERDRDSARV